MQQDSPLQQRPLLPLRIGLLAVLLMFIGASRASAAPHESKVFIYVVYNGGSKPQKAYASALLAKFNQLGFSEKMKRKGVSWVDASYGSSSAAAQYLHIAPDDIIYFGILMADSTDRMTREMYRARVTVPVNASDPQIMALADRTAHEFYFAVADVVDNFSDKSRWSRQTALLDARDQKATPTRVTLEGKEISRNKDLFPLAPYKRQNIPLVMVAFSPALFKKLGADDAGIGRASGGRQALWIKRGKARLTFETGPQLIDMKTYIAVGGERRFVSPIRRYFAYPEVEGGSTFVPLNLVIKTLSLPYEVEDSGASENLMRKK